jgi:hypothetical protein
MRNERVVVFTQSVIEYPTVNPEPTGIGATGIQYK